MLNPVKLVITTINKANIFKNLLITSNTKRLHSVNCRKCSIGDLASNSERFYTGNSKGSACWKYGAHKSDVRDIFCLYSVNCKQCSVGDLAWNSKRFYSGNSKGSTCWKYGVHRSDVRDMFYLYSVNCRKCVGDLASNSKRFYSGNSKGSACWKCGAQRSDVRDIFCDKCNVLQAPSQSENYFNVFGFNSDYNLDVKALRQKYRKMQSVLHPDKFSNKSDEEKAISADYSSLLNKAFNTLQSPLSRALHLLRLNRESIGEDDKASDPGFLMAIMELNEEVEEAKTPEQLQQLNVKNNEMLEELGVEVSKFFQVKDIVKAKEVVVKMKYYASLSKRINDLLRERGVTD